MKCKATVQIFWESDDAPAELTRDYQAKAFTIEDLLVIADHVFVEFTEDRKAVEPTCIQCDKVEAECECDVFDSERK